VQLDLVVCQYFPRVSFWVSFSTPITHLNPCDHSCDEAAATGCLKEPGLASCLLQVRVRRLIVTGRKLASTYRRKELLVEFWRVAVLCIFTELLSPQDTHTHTNFTHGNGRFLCVFLAVSSPDIWTFSTERLFFFLSNFYFGLSWSGRICLLVIYIILGLSRSNVNFKIWSYFPRL
jgi:hypothetical protein